MTFAGHIDVEEAPDLALLDREYAPEKRLMFAILKDAIKCREAYRLAAHDRERRLSGDAASTRGLD